MRDESEKVWLDVGKMGDTFKFDYDRLLALIPNDVSFKRSDLSSKNHKIKDMSI